VGRAAQAAIPSFDAGDGRSIFLFDPFVLPKRIRNGRIPEKTGPPAQRPRRATAWGRRRAGCGQLAARRGVAIPLSRCASGSGLRAVNRSRYLSVPGPKGFAASFPTSGGKRVVRNDSSLRPGPCSLRGNESLGFSRLCCGASGGDPSALKGPGKIFVVSSEPLWRCRRFAALRLRRIVFRSERSCSSCRRRFGLADDASSPGRAFQPPVPDGECLRTGRNGLRRRAKVVR